MSTEKTTTENGNLPILRVMWRNWILPFAITVLAMVIIAIVFQIVPENRIPTDFLAGWLSCIVWYVARKHYAT